MLRSGEAANLGMRRHEIFDIRIRDPHIVDGKRPILQPERDRIGGAGAECRPALVPGYFLVREQWCGATFCFRPGKLFGECLEYITDPSVRPRQKGG